MGLEVFLGAVLIRILGEYEGPSSWSGRYPLGVTNPLASIESETGWAPETGLSLCKKKNALTLPAWNPDLSIVLSPELSWLLYTKGTRFYNVRGMGFDIHSLQEKVVVIPNNDRDTSCLGDITFLSRSEDVCLSYDASES